MKRVQSKKLGLLSAYALAFALSLSGCAASSEISPMQLSESIVNQTDVLESAGESENSIFSNMEEVKISDWFVTQPETEKQILAEISGGYTVDSPLVVIDPYDTAPLTALIIFEEDKDCSVKITVPGKTADTTFSHTFKEMQKHHEIPVYGLYAGQENAVKLELLYQDGTSKAVAVPVKTEPLPEYLPPYKVLVNEPDKIGGDGDELLYIAMATDTVYPIAIDKQGDVRWYSSRQQFSGGIFRRGQDGKFLAFSEPLYAPAFIRPGIVKMDRMGKVYREYLTDLTHHDAIELPDGNLMIATMRPGSEIPMNGMTLGLDVVVEKNAETGEVLREWDLNSICGYRTDELKTEKYSGEDPFSGQFLHINSLCYNKTDNTIMVSSPTMKVVVKFRADTSEIVWAIGDPRHGYPEPLQSKILTPVGEYFEWNGAQHAAMVLPNGHIMMDDNGSGRLDYAGDPVPDAENYSRLVIFDVNEADMTIRQVYQYGKERGNELFATYLGDADYLGENHYLLNAGGRIVGDDGIAQGSAFDVYMGIKHAEAKIVEVQDDKVVFEIHVGDTAPQSFNNIYRVEWDSVYGVDEKEYDIVGTKAQRFGQLTPSAEVEYVLPEEYEELSVKASPIDYSYQLNVPVIVEDMGKEDILFMELRSEDKVYYYPTIGMGGAQGIVRSEGLPACEYAIGFVLKKKDGSTAYTQIGEKWIPSQQRD